MPETSQPTPRNFAETKRITKTGITTGFKAQSAILEGILIRLDMARRPSPKEADWIAKKLLSFCLNISISINQRMFPYLLVLEGS
jgi:hypothetical protein